MTKKRRKTMESASITIYEQRVRRNLLNNLSYFLIVGLFSLANTVFAESSAFLILNEGVDLASKADQLESQGAHVRQRIPPQILLADLPNEIKINSISGVKSAYSSPIPLSILEPLGDLAVAAGMQWNRRMLKESKIDTKTIGAMRVLVAQRSLPASQKVTLTPSDHLLRVEWEAVDGALYYEIEGASDISFAERLLTTRSNRTSVELPMLEGKNGSAIFVRVRGNDLVENEGTTEEVMGGWSRPASVPIPSISVTVSPSDPILTSPLSDYVSEGFTLILEWTSQSAEQTRVQVARSKDFKTVLYDTVVSGSEFVIPSPGLRVGDELFWRVKSWGNQRSAWSDVRSLRIGQPRSEKTDMFINPEAPK